MTLAPALFPDARELHPRMGDASLFGGLQPLVYMNHAGISPPSAVVKKAVAGMLADYGRRGAAAFGTWMAQRDRLRGKLATLVGAAEPGEIALTQNTSQGISHVALSLPWARGDRVVIFDGEFPANVIPWLRTEELFGTEPVWLDGRRFATDEAGLLEDLRGTLGAGRVRVVAVSEVQFQTGRRVPVRAIADLCREVGARLLVDAVQACGAVPVDVRAEGADYLACGAHKWLMGVEGAGFLYASRDAARELVPRTAGWLSFQDGTDFLFEGAGRLRYDRPTKSDLSFLEGANVSTASFAALEAALDLLLELEPKRIFDHVQSIHDRLEPGAVELGMVSVRAPATAGRSGSLCLLPPGDVAVGALHAAITQQGIACAMPDGHLRLSPHWWNAPDEADQVLLSLGESLRLARSA